MTKLVTVAADGTVRRAFSVTDFERMAEVGLLGHDERIELVKGELRPMAAKGIRHEILKTHLAMFFGKARPDSIMYAQEPGWVLDDLTYLEPDFLLFPAAKPFATVRGADALLVIEVAASSRTYDLGEKMRLYAEFGVREFWVIDAATRETHVFLRPATDGYADHVVYGPTVLLQPEFISGLTLRLADLPEA